jgi:hypothetical protein
MKVNSIAGITCYVADLSRTAAFSTRPSGSARASRRRTERPSTSTGSSSPSSPWIRKTILD